MPFKPSRVPQKAYNLTVGSLRFLEIIGPNIFLACLMGSQSADKPHNKIPKKGIL